MLTIYTLLDKFTTHSKMYLHFNLKFVVVNKWDVCPHKNSAKFPAKNIVGVYKKSNHCITWYTELRIVFLLAASPFSLTSIEK